MGLRPWLWSIWLGIAAALGGCSSKPLSDGSMPSLAPPAMIPPGTTIEDACGALQQGACGDFQRCAPESFQSAYPDLPTCVSVRTADCVERRSAPGNTVTPDQIAACAQASMGAACSAVVANEYGLNPAKNPACIWQGTLPDGQACITSSQCESGTCAFYDRDRCGTCVTRADDSGCITSAECLVGSVCISGQCIATSKAGEACGSLQPCSAELTCQAGACVELGGAGDPCPVPDSGGCAPNLWCNRQTGNCEHSTIAEGQAACGLTMTGSNVLCPAGKLCLPEAATAINRCVLAGAEGATCSYQLECGVGLDCYESVCSKVDAAACVASTTTPNATYPAFLPSVPQGVAPNDATVLASPKVVLVTFEGDSRADALEAYVSALGSSRYWHSVTAEYGVGALLTLPPIRVAETPPDTISDTGIQMWLSDKLTRDSRFPPSDGLTLYIVAYPRGVTVSFPGTATGTGESCRDFGGYHDAFADAAGTPTPYAVIPDCFYADPGAAISHEAVEAATDPFGGLLAGFSVTRGYAVVDALHEAWSLPAEGGSELADLCEWQPLTSLRDPEVGGIVQRSWSNAAMAGFHQPCVPARAGSVYFNAVPHADDLVTMQSLGTTVRTHGSLIPVGKSITIPVDLLSDGPMDGPWRVSAYDLKEWSHEFDYTAKAEPTLRFSFDQQSGVNGDTLQMTITVSKQDSDFQAEPFVLVSRRGRDTNLWVGVVGQH